MKFSQFYMARRGPTVAAEAFPDRWREHAALFASFELVETPFSGGHYMLVDHERSEQPQDGAPFDGLGLFLVEDIEAMWALGVEHPEKVAALKEDELAVFGGSLTPQICIGERRVLAGEDKTGFAVMLLRQRNPDMSVDAFGRAWIDHLRALLKVPAVGDRVRLAVYTVVDQAGSAEYCYDGLTELWVDTPEDMTTVLDAIRANRTADKEKGWVIPERSRNMATSEVPNSLSRYI